MDAATDEPEGRQDRLPPRRADACLFDAADRIVVTPPPRPDGPPGGPLARILRSLAPPGARRR